MKIKTRFILGITCGLSIYFALLTGSQINLATEAVSILNNCESSKIIKCLSNEAESRLTNRWDGNLKVYWVLSMILAIACGYFTPRFKK
jgi:predicted transporter